MASMTDPYNLLGPLPLMMNVGGDGLPPSGSMAALMMSGASPPFYGSAGAQPWPPLALAPRAATIPASEPYRVQDAVASLLGRAPAPQHMPLPAQRAEFADPFGFAGREPVYSQARSDPLNSFLAITPSSDLANDGAGVTASLERLRNLVGSAASDVYKNSILKARDDLTRLSERFRDDPHAEISSVLNSFPATNVEGTALDGMLFMLGALRNARAVEAYEVGPYNALKARSPANDGLVVHHAVQKNPAYQVIPEYNWKTGPSITIPEVLHRAFENLRGLYTGTPRELLGKDIWNLRTNTDASNEALQELIELNKSTYPGSFDKVPK